MNYRHSYHAGNFADVLKHATLVLILEALRRKEKAFRVLDTHAGAGLYDLSAPEAQRTGEFRDGIGRLLADPAPPRALASYLRLVRTLNHRRGSGLSVYPGSPMIIRSMLRSVDHLIAFELHPADAIALSRGFAGQRQVMVRRQDGYQGLKAMLPPPERRGLVLIDPPFESRDEFARLETALTDAHRRFATGIIVVWYPVKDREPVATFHAAVADLGIPSILRAELMRETPRDPTRLNGCGLLVVNPPWQLDLILADLLPDLARRLARGEGAHGRVDWLVPEPHPHSAD